MAADSGARWLITGQTSGRYLYKNGDTITGNLDFFSLFELRRTAEGTYAIKEQTGGWLGLHAQPDGPPQLGIVAPLYASPPPPPPPMSDKEWKAALEDGQERKAELWAQMEKEKAAHAVVAAAAAEAEAQRFYIDEQSNGAFTMRLANGGYVYENAYDPGFGFVALDAKPVDKSQGASSRSGSVFKRSWWWKQSAGLRAFNDSALFQFHRVVAPNRKGGVEMRGKAAARAAKSGGKGIGGGGSFQRRVRRSTIRVSDRDVVVATYHNIGMLDWATLFWGWLATSGIDRFLLLELDGVTCEAARALNCSLQFECATAHDMKLPEEYTHIANSGALQEWGTSAESAYFKFLRWKLRLTELCLVLGVDVIMIDVDVLVLSPNFVTTLVKSPSDLVISSDQRMGIYDDNIHCPCSHPQYQRYTSDWVCAGMFYMRSTQASIWFMREVQRLMDDFTITDQDAIQAMLTGHTQVAVPQAKKGNDTDAPRTPWKPGRPSNAWLKPLWLEGLGSKQDLKNQAGILPLNTPMKEGMWQKCKARQAEKKFTWQLLPLDRFGNGPALVHYWDAVFSKSTTSGRVGDAAGNFLSIHANCWTKQWLTARDTAKSFLFDPRVKRAARGSRLEA